MLGKRWEGGQFAAPSFFRPLDDSDAGGATLLRKISNATLACRFVPVLRRSGGSGMIPWWCSFSPQNPVGMRLVQMCGQGVVVNIRAVIAY